LVFCCACALSIFKRQKEKRERKKKKKKREKNCFSFSSPAHPHVTFRCSQEERAFQKQPQIFQGLRTKPIKGLKRSYARSSTKTTRYWKQIGLGYKVPAAAQTGDYVDKKCPFTGSVSIRGRILRGKVVKMHMKRTIIVRRDYMHFIPKYKRYEKRHRHFPAHVSPAFRLSLGDVVEVGQCRPLSKTVRFNVIKVVTSADPTAAFSKF
jgi:small subunit ribosomal protein S11e